MLVVTAALPVTSVRELVAYAKANPGKLNFASVGNGSSSHLTMELLEADEVGRSQRADRVLVPVTLLSAGDTSSR